MLGCDLNSSPGRNTPFLLKHVGGLQPTWCQPGLIKTGSCEPVEELTVLQNPAFHLGRKCKEVY